MKKFWEMKQLANTKSAEIYIYGEVVAYKWDDSDTTGASFQKDLKALGDVAEINLHINSPGGSVFEGIAIGNMLKSHKAVVTGYVDALAASIASVILSSCDKVVMPENSMLMIHNPYGPVIGNAKELRKTADDYDKIAESSVITYLAKANGKLTEEKIKQIMDEETWLSAKESYEIGLCDEVIEAVHIAACADASIFEKYKNVPSQLVVKNEEIVTEERIRIADNAKQENLLMQTILGGL